MNKNNGARALSIDICARSSYKIQVGAVLTDKNGRIFAWGWNHPSADGFTEHAEAHAVSRANHYRLRGLRLIVAGRKQKNGSWVWVLSKPCERKCLPMALNLGISEVEFITPSGDWEILKLKYARVR